MIGQRILHFEILDRLGKGGMGEVYLAKDTRLDRHVALKFLPEHVRQNEHARARFLREARAASKLTHTHIAGVYSIEETDEYDFIVMEYVRGQSLRREIEENDISVERAVEISSEIAGALETAHQAGIVHRDVKPENVLITEDGTAKVVDFGIAQVSGAKTLTETSATVGTAVYMSPEQCKGETIDARSDLFSLGSVLYEMVTGKRPFDGPYAASITYAIVNQDPDPASSINPEVPAALNHIISRCLAKNPNSRYASASALQSDLDSVFSDSPTASPTAIIVGAPTPHPSTGRWLTLTLVGLLAIIVALFVFRGSSSEFESIAVLPFENSTGDPDVEFLCDGIPESLINRLSLIPDFKVISRSSAFAFREQAASLGEIGKALDVQTVLVGRLERRGDELSISTELINLSDNSQIWGEKYRRSSNDILEIEDEIAASIANHLQLRLSKNVENRLVKSGTVDPEAYQLYLKGRFLAVGSLSEMNLGLDYLREAVAISPGFALGHAGIADALATRGWLSLSPREELVPEATASIQTALSIDPELPEVQTALGNIRTIFEWDWDGAETAFKMAIAKGPSNALAYQRYSDLLATMNRGEEALAMARIAQQLDPVAIAPTHWVGISYLLLDNFESAAAEFKKLTEIHPDWSWGYIKLATSYAFAGRFEEALQVAAEAEAINGSWGTAWEQSWLGSVYAMSGRPDLAQRAVDRILERADSEYVDPFTLGQAYAALCDRDSAFMWLQKAVEERSPNAIYMKVIELTAPECVTGDARYAALLRDMGFPGSI
ncbi:MAG: serine/threonine-protein kinase [Rhodothermia bacterium]|nr:MAG: serine/threonine-protein kinase [Rhodothermia bacterium]